MAYLNISQCLTTHTHEATFHLNGDKKAQFAIYVVCALICTGEKKTDDVEEREERLARDCAETL